MPNGEGVGPLPFFGYDPGMADKKPSPYLTVKEAAEFLGINASSIYEMVAANLLVHHRIGPKNGRIRFKASDLDAYVESVRSGPEPKVVKPPKREVYVPKHPM